MRKRKTRELGNAVQVISINNSFESSSSTYGPFLLNRYALTWIVEGGGVTSLDQEAISTSPGTVLSMLPGMRLLHDWGKLRSFQTFIVFDFSRWPDGLPLARDWPRARQLNGSESMLGLWRYLLAVQHVPSSRPLLRNCVELLLRMFVSGVVDGRASTAPSLPRAVERALDFMLARVERKGARVELGSVARAAGVTPQHLCRLFRRELDASPLECGHMMRVEHAAGVLERTDKGLAEVAESVGYSSAFHFSRVFKQIYGVPPSEYRRAFVAGKASRPGGLVFRHHRLRQYLYESGPGRVIVAKEAFGAVRSR